MLPTNLTASITFYFFLGLFFTFFLGLFLFFLASGANIPLHPSKLVQPTWLLPPLFILTSTCNISSFPGLNFSFILFPMCGVFSIEFVYASLNDCMASSHVQSRQDRRCLWLKVLGGGSLMSDQMLEHNMFHYCHKVSFNVFCSPWLSICLFNL